MQCVAHAAADSHLCNIDLTRNAAAVHQAGESASQDDGGVSPSHDDKAGKVNFHQQVCCLWLDGCASTAACMSENQQEEMLALCYVIPKCAAVFESSAC